MRNVPKEKNNEDYTELWSYATTSAWVVINTSRILLKFVYLADFLKTNLTKFGVIWVKRRRKAGFLGEISSKITLTKERKGKEKKKERGGRKEEKRKKQLLRYYFFYNGYFADSFLPKKTSERKRSISR